MRNKLGGQSTNRTFAFMQCAVLPEEQRHVQRILQLLVLPGCSGSDPMCIFFGSNASAAHLQQHYLDLLAIIITCMPHQVDTAAMARGGQYALWVERHTIVKHRAQGRRWGAL